MKDSKRVLIVDDMHESILPLLKNEGFEPVYLPVIRRDEILEIIPEFEGLFIRSKTRVDKELVDKAGNLTFVARAGAGLDKLNEEYLKSKGIIIVNAPEGNRDALAEHTLGMLLSILHRLHFAHQQVRQGIWDRKGNRGVELKGKVVGIYGVGYMGKAFARKLTGMCCEVIGYDKYASDFKDESVKSVSLEELFRRTEILSIHVPLNDETRYLFDKLYLSKFQNLKILINTARGKILRTEDVADLLDQGSIYGAAMDVLENERPETYSDEEKTTIDRLSNHPSVIITPHIGGWTYESYQRINEVLIEKLKAAFEK
ncbi:MAG: NAD(P)-dependent oxidoreductase [Bacteroidota bacterium]